MRPLERLIRLLGAVAVLSAVTVGPVWAAESPATSPSPAADAGAQEGQPAEGSEPASGEEGGEGGRAEPPLDLNDPQDLVGAAMLALTGLAVLLGGRNLVQQLRGERPQADGSWRPR
ncbi:MAG TPA: hypothetical protein VHF25_00720 [Nitriliruptorales bacterium]|nr:hypothetical protein [Nitriliruptorales bacterium]